jgi:hypothetical protein
VDFEALSESVLLSFMLIADTFEPKYRGVVLAAGGGGVDRTP